MTKVVLVSSPHFDEGRLAANQSPGLVAVATCLARAGMDVRLLDVNSLGGDPRLREAPAAILESGPSAVGFSTLGASYPVTLRLVREVAASRPGLPIVLGGSQATTTAAATLAAFPEVDVVVRGRCEAFVAEVFEALGSERSRARLAEIPGIAFRDGGTVVARPLAPDPEPWQMPEPDHRFVAGQLGDPDNPVFVEAGLGCPARCRFCSVGSLTSGRRMLPVPRVVSVIRGLHERFGTRRVSLICDCLTQDRGWVVSFCEALGAARLPVSWWGQTRADLVDEPLLAAMRDAGCETLYFGVESGSERVQRAVAKRLDPARTRRALAAAGARGLAVTAAVVIGFPDETREELADTVRLAADLVSSSEAPRFTLQVHLLTPLAGSPLEAEHRGALVRDGIVSDLAEGASLPGDEELIAAHPDLFPAHFHIPVAGLPRRLLVRLRSILMDLPELKASTLVLLRDPSLGFPERLIADLGPEAPAEEPVPGSGRGDRRLEDLLDAAGRLDGWIARENPGHPLRELLRLEVALKRVRSGAEGKGEVLALGCDAVAWLRAIREKSPLLPDPPASRPARYLLAREGGSVTVSALQGLAAAGSKSR